MCPAAVDGLNSLVFQLAQAVDNVVEIGQHQAEEDPPHEISKAGKCHQRDRQVKQIAGLRLRFSSLLQHAAVQQFVERAATPCRFQHAIQRVQPDRSFKLHRTQHRLQTFRDAGNIHAVVIQIGRRSLAEILHQQEVRFVALRVTVRRLRQEMLQQQNQPLGIHHRTGLQKLPQLMHLHLVVDGIQPQLRLLHRLRSRRLHGAFKIGANRHLKHKLTRQFGVNGMQAAGIRPHPRQFRSRLRAF